MGLLKQQILNFEKRARKIEKRFRLVASVLILVAAMLASTFFYFDKAIFFLPILLILSYFLTYFSLLEGIEELGWFGFFLLPVLFTISFYLFYFLFPARWLTRIPFIAIYGISIYAILLCSNIFNVGVEKNLQLYRAAFSVNFFYQSVAAFLIFNLLFSFQQNFLINTLVVGGVGFLLSFHAFWTIRLKKYIEPENVIFAGFIGLVLAQLAFILSFIPLQTAIYGLFLTASYYSLSGLFYNFLDQRLFKETVREYVTVWAFVLVITLLSISW